MRVCEHDLAALRSPRAATLPGSRWNIPSGITLEKLAMPSGRFNGRMFGVCGVSQYMGGITPPPPPPPPSAAFLIN